MTAPRKVGILTAGGLAPCLSAAVGMLIERYTSVAPDIAITGYRDGFRGLLTGEQLEVTPLVRQHAARLQEWGGSPLGNSRVKLTNGADCAARGLIQPGQDPQQVAADRLRADGIDVLHTIGGDDTNTAAAELAAFLGAQGHPLTVIGLPKTVDNDVEPIVQTLGAATAADAGAIFFEHVAAEHSANPRMLVIHEVMGRASGWLTAATAARYRNRLATRAVVPEFGLARERWDIHGVYLPEMNIDIKGEAARLQHVMDTRGNVNLFISEGAGVDTIVREMTAAGDAMPRDAFGHVKLDAINPGAWFGKQFAAMLGAEKTLVQKSGYFARSSPANAEDLGLIARTVDVAVDAALHGRAGVAGGDVEAGGAMTLIDFGRIRGGRRFDPHADWFAQVLHDIGQPIP
jgi:pyrophosphate--fructose-6-phosphate 1-phosphotransferase